MKAQCEKCKKIVPLRFRTTEEGGICVDCPECKQQYVVAGDRGAHAKAPVQRADPPGVKPRLPTGDMVCTKCGESQPQSAACRACGLVPKNWIPGQASQRAGTLEEKLWAACEAEWQAEDPHDALLAYCKQCGAYAFAATRYRNTLRARGGDDPIASARLAQLLLLAETALANSAGKEPLPSTRRAAVIAFAVFLVGSGLLYGGFSLFSD